MAVTVLDEEERTHVVHRPLHDNLLADMGWCGATAFDDEDGILRLARFNYNCGFCSKASGDWV